MGSVLTGTAELGQGSDFSTGRILYTSNKGENIWHFLFIIMLNLKVFFDTLSKTSLEYQGNYKQKPCLFKDISQNMKKWFLAQNKTIF